MKIEDAIAAVAGEAGEAVRLHQGVVTDTDYTPPFIRVGKSNLQIPVIGTVAVNDIVQILSAGSRWVVLGKVAAGAAPNLVPADGWAWNLKGSAACTVQVPDTRMSFSGDSIAAQKARTDGFGEGAFTEGMDPGYFFIDQGYYSMMHQINPSLYCLARLITDPLAKNHVTIELTGPSGQFSLQDIRNASTCPIDTTASSIIRMFAVVRVAAGSNISVHWYPDGPGITVEDIDVIPYWRKGSSYINAHMGPIPNDPAGIHTYESELKPDGSTRIWIDGVLRTPTNVTTSGVITHPMFVPALNGPSVNFFKGTGYLYEWLTASDMNEEQRAAAHQRLRDTYLP